MENFKNSANYFSVLGIKKKRKEIRIVGSVKQLQKIYRFGMARVTRKLLNSQKEWYRRLQKASSIRLQYSISSNQTYDKKETAIIIINLLKFGLITTTDI